VHGDTDACIDGLAEVVRAGAGNLILNFVFDEERQMEHAAAHVLPRLRSRIAEIDREPMKRDR